MPVILTTSRRLANAETYDRWCAAAGDGNGLDANRQVTNLAVVLEQAFDETFETWSNLARQLAGQPSAELAHMPTCATNISDFGLMLAWAHLVTAWNGEDVRTLVVCDDPWLYRHLCGLGISQASSPPGLILRESRLRLRGLLARTRVALRLTMTSLSLRLGPQAQEKGAPALLVYGHPASTADGVDGYFANLMNEISGLGRMLHVDAPLVVARRLQADERTHTLHAWGSPGFATVLPFKRWKPKASGDYAWLVRRAAALEGATGQPAMIGWQIHCQNRWLARIKPAVVAWPWENHSWERDFIRTARRLGVKTLGYQHATVAGREWNYSPRSNSDGPGSLPDRIFCVGQLDRQRLLAMGHDGAHVAIGGALRFAEPSMPAYDQRAPVFVALPFDPDVAAQMITAISNCAGSERRFLVRDHPMAPFAFRESGQIARSGTPLDGQKTVSALFFSATTVGLEAAIVGLPVIRFVTDDRVLTDPLPEEMSAVTATVESLAQALEKVTTSLGMERNLVFAAPDDVLWRKALDRTDHPEVSDTEVSDGGVS